MNSDKNPSIVFCILAIITLSIFSLGYMNVGNREIVAKVIDKEITSYRYVNTYYLYLEEDDGINPYKAMTHKDYANIEIGGTYGFTVSSTGYVKNFEILGK